MNVVHGMSRSRPHRIWANMWTRCTNPKSSQYKNYGAKGVTLCKRWHSFENFWADMKSGYAEGLQLDRKKNSRGYCKSNCRWVTPKQQQRNRTNNRFINTPKGRMTIAQANETFGIRPGLIACRIFYGWPEHLLLAPVKKNTQ